MPLRFHIQILRLSRTQTHSKCPPSDTRPPFSPAPPLIPDQSPSPFPRSRCPHGTRGPMTPHWNIFISVSLRKTVAFLFAHVPERAPVFPPAPPPARASPAAPRRPRHTEIENDASKVGQKNSDLIYIYAVDCGMGYSPPLQASPAARAREGWGQRALHPPLSKQNSFWFIPRRRGEPRRSSIRGPTARRRRIGGEG